MVLCEWHTRRREVAPFVRLDIVLRDTLPSLIHHPKVALCVRLALFSCLASPRRRLPIVLRDALPAEIRPSKAVLGFCVSLLRRFAIPRRRLRVVLRDALTEVIRIPKVVLSFCVARVRFDAEGCGLRRVGGDRLSSSAERIRDRVTRWAWRELGWLSEGRSRWLLKRCGMSASPCFIPYSRERRP